MRLDGGLKEVAQAVGGGYCRLQTPLKLALGVRGIVAGHRPCAWKRGGGGWLPPPSSASRGGGVPPTRGAAAPGRSPIGHTALCKQLLRVIVDQLPVDEAVDAVVHDLLAFLLHLLLLRLLNLREFCDGIHPHAGPENLRPMAKGSGAYKPPNGGLGSGPVCIGPNEQRRTPPALNRHRLALNRIG